MDTNQHQQTPQNQNPTQPSESGNDPLRYNPNPTVTPVAPDPPQEEEKKEGIKNIISTVAILVIAPIIALTLTTFVFQSYEVDGPSMEKTLQHQDRLIVYKMPKTIARITGSQYLPNRGDIVIFNHDEGVSFGNGNSGRQLIKRVVALPGDRVVIKNGKITVYTKDIPNGYNPDEQFKDLVVPAIAGDDDLVIPEGMIYVCGDNRPQSLDSRSFGPVPTENLVGKLSIRVYPFNKAKTY